MIRISSIIYCLGFCVSVIACAFFLLHQDIGYEIKNSNSKKMQQIRHFPKKELFLCKANHEYVHTKLMALSSTLEADSLEHKVKLQEKLEQIHCSIASLGQNGENEMRTIEASSGILDYNKKTLETQNTQMQFSEQSKNDKKITLCGKASKLCIDFTENPPHFEAMSFSGSYNAK